MKKPNNITHARIESSHLLAPGLFRSLRKGERKTSKLDITYDFGYEKSVRFWGPEPLGADDLRILRAIVGLASRAHNQDKLIVLDADTTSDLGISLRRDLFLEDYAVRKSTVITRTSLREIAVMAGYSSGGAKIEQIKASIDRLWAVSIIAKSGAISEGYRLISRYKSDDGVFMVALNMKLAEVMLSSSRYAYIDFDEANALKSDSAVLLHSRLCAMVDFNKSLKIGMEKLSSYVYHDEPETSENTVKYRRKSVRDALDEIKNVGWKVVANGDIFTITRNSKKS